MITSLGVVPIFVNAGAALLPAILAGLASFGMLFLRPRELIKACAKRPYIPALLLLLGMGLWFLLRPSEAPAEPRARRGPSKAETGRSDWAAVALEILRQEAQAKARGAVVPAVLSSATSQSRARCFRGGPARSGWEGGSAPLGLIPLWEYAPENTLFLSSPLVVGARVYGASCVLDPPTSYGSVFCLDAETGRPLWVSEFRDGAAQKEFKGFFSSPALSADGKSLVIGQGLHSDADCELVCLDADTGRVRWLLKTPLHIEGSPAIEGDLVIAGAGAIEAGDDHRAVGNPGFVLAVRISDGKELWRFTVADPESSPVVEDGVAYIGSGLNGNAIVALRTLGDEELRAKGLSRVLWQTPTGYPATGAVTLAGDRVLVGCGKGDFVYAARDPEGCVIALDRTSGRELWRAALPDTVLGSIAVREGKALCPVRNGEVVALDLESGRILWRHGISRGMPVLSGPAFAEGYVYAVSQDGTLAVLDGATGSRIEKVYLNSTAKPPSMGLSVSSPMVAEGRLYVGSETGGLRCFAGSRGR